VYDYVGIEKLYVEIRISVYTTGVQKIVEKFPLPIMIDGNKRHNLPLLMETFRANV